MPWARVILPADTHQVTAVIQTCPIWKKGKVWRCVLKLGWLSPADAGRADLPEQRQSRLRFWREFWECQEKCLWFPSRSKLKVSPEISNWQQGRQKVQKATHMARLCLVFLPKEEDCGIQTRGVTENVFVWRRLRNEKSSERESRRTQAGHRVSLSVWTRVRNS